MQLDSMVKLRLPVQQPSITLIRGTWYESTASDFDGAADPLGLTRLLENLRFSLPDSCREQPFRPTIGSLPENAVHGNGQGPVRRRQARADQTSSPRRRLNRPNFTQFSAVSWRVTQEHARPFCTMKMRLARDFCDNCSRDLRGLPRRRFLSTLG